MVLAEVMIVTSQKLQPSSADHQQKRYTVTLLVEGNLPRHLAHSNVFMEVSAQDQCHLKRVIGQSNTNLGFYQSV